MSHPYDFFNVHILDRKERLCLRRTSEMYPEDAAGSVRAKAICRGCANISPCLEWALEHEEMHGTWGGLSQNERRKVIQSRRRSKGLLPLRS